MTEHLTDVILNAVVDGELAGNELASANEHLAVCPSCTAHALHRSLLKSATAKAAQRYAPPPHLRERLTRLASEENARLQGRAVESTPAPTARPVWRFASLGWAAAAILLAASASLILYQRATQRAEMASAEHAALVTEVFDQHVAALAGNMPPQVLSSDRHTVKPWFQGKIPFSFNLPQGLPGDTTLEGANLTYLRNQPVAQLLYSIGKHRVSVFLRQKTGAADASEFLADRSGFHVIGFQANDLEAVAVSDVDPARLAELASAIRHAQTVEPGQPR